MKVQKINFEVDMSKGELPFRTYASTKPVNGKLFVIVSKLNADNNVFFQMYLLDSKTGDANVIRETLVTQDKFTDIVQAVEDDLRTADSTVEFKVQNGESIAIASDGEVLNDKEGLFALVKGVMTGTISNEEAANVFMSLDATDKIKALQIITESQGGLGQLHPQALAAITKMVTMIDMMEGGIECDCPNCAPEKHGKSKVDPSDRISKYL